MTPQYDASGERFFFDCDVCDREFSPVLRTDDDVRASGWALVDTRDETLVFCPPCRAVVARTLAEDDQ